MTSTILGAYRTTQEKERLKVFEIWKAERNGKTGELAQRGADLHGGPLAEIRASEVTQARIEVSLAVEHVAHFLCLVNEWVDREDILPKEEHMEVCEQSEEANEHRMEWCVGINRSRCTRCSRGRRWLGEEFNAKLCRWEGRHVGDQDLVRVAHDKCEICVWCRKCAGYSRFLSLVQSFGGENAQSSRHC